LALKAALQQAGCAVPLLFYSTGVMSGVQWLEAAVKAKPELLSKVDAFSCHPYGRIGQNNEDRTGLGALEAQHAVAVQLGFKYPVFYVTETGFNIKGEENSENVASEAAQAEQLDLYLEGVEKIPADVAGFFY